jgi:phenylacetate-CoA ligase
MYRWIAWNILFRLHERAKGHATFRMLREMEAADSYTEGQLEELRCRKLRDLIGYAYAHVPYFRTRMRETGVEPGRIREPKDLTLLPVMRKADVRKNRELLRSEIAGKLASFTTGGSTGEPLIFDLSKRRVASRVACRMRTSRWWGVQVGDPEIAIWGSPVELNRQDTVRKIRDYFLSTQLLSAFEMNAPTMSQYLDRLERSHCRQLFGYPSAIYLLCLHARKEGRNLRRLGIKVTFVTGEVLFPYQRELIVETLNCPVANGYGARDSALIAHECPQGGMHVLSDAVILELLDPSGRPVQPGQPGEIVVTDLYSHEAPFIRYCTGDIAVLSSRNCSCGRALPLLESVEGRANDSVVAPDGRIINSLALIYPVRAIEGIERFRVCQRSLDCFHVQVVRTEGFPLDAEDRIRRNWAQLFRAPVRVTFEYLPEISPEKSGKFRHVISEVPAGELQPRH